MAQRERSAARRRGRLSMLAAYLLTTTPTIAYDSKETIQLASQDEAALALSQYTSLDFLPPPTQFAPNGVLLAENSRNGYLQDSPYLARRLHAEESEGTRRHPEDVKPFKLHPPQPKAAKAESKPVPSPVVQEAPQTAAAAEVDAVATQEVTTLTPPPPPPPLEAAPVVASVSATPAQAPVTDNSPSAHEVSLSSYEKSLLLKTISGETPPPILPTISKEASVLIPQTDTMEKPEPELEPAPVPATKVSLAEQNEQQLIRVLEQPLPKNEQIPKSSHGLGISAQGAVRSEGDWESIPHDKHILKLPPPPSPTAHREKPSSSLEFPSPAQKDLEETAENPPPKSKALTKIAAALKALRNNETQPSQASAEHKTEQKIEPEKTALLQPEPTDSSSLRGGVADAATQPDHAKNAGLLRFARNDESENGSHAKASPEPEPSDENFSEGEEAFLKLSSQSVKTDDPVSPAPSTFLQDSAGVTTEMQTEEGSSKETLPKEHIMKGWSSSDNQAVKTSEKRVLSPKTPALKKKPSPEADARQWLFPEKPAKIVRRHLPNSKMTSSEPSKNERSGAPQVRHLPDPGSSFSVATLSPESSERADPTPLVPKIVVESAAEPAEKLKLEPKLKIAASEANKIAEKSAVFSAPEPAIISLETKNSEIASTPHTLMEGNMQPKLPESSPDPVSAPIASAAKPAEELRPKPEPQLKIASKAVNKKEEIAPQEIAKRDVVKPPVKPVVFSSPEPTIISLGKANPDIASTPRKLMEDSMQPKLPDPNPEPVSIPLPKEIAQYEPKLSAESKAVLERLPSGIGSPKPVKPAAPVAMQHSSTPDMQVKEGRVDMHEAQGVQIKVARPAVNVNQLMEDAYHALMKEDFATAMDRYQQVLEADPKQAEAKFGLATTYHRMGELVMARELYANILEDDPDNLETLNNLLVLVSQESPKESLQELKKLEMRNPDFSPIPAQMAAIYAQLKNFDAAIESIQRAIRIDPKNLAYRYNAAVLMDRAGKHEAAISLYRDLKHCYERGEDVPANIATIQERLTFLLSNRG